MIHQYTNVCLIKVTWNTYICVLKVSLHCQLSVWFEKHPWLNTWMDSAKRIWWPPDARGMVGKGLKGWKKKWRKQSDGRKRFLVGVGPDCAHHTLWHHLCSPYFAPYFERHTFITYQFGVASSPPKPTFVCVNNPQLKAHSTKIQYFAHIPCVLS